MRLKRTVTFLGVLVTVITVLVGSGGAVIGADPIRIGVIEPLTGPCAYDGQSVVAGAKMAEEEINAAGGVLGRSIKLIVEDGKADPAESVSAAQKLLTRDRVSCLMGAWASSATLAVMPILPKYGVPMLVETSSATKITQLGNKWIFRIASTEELAAQALEKHLVSKLGFTKVAFLVVNNDWGRGAVEYYGKVIQNGGGKVVTAEYHAAGETNFYPFLTKIKASGADSLIITTDVQTVGMVVKQAHELGLNMPRLATSGMPADVVVRVAGREASEGLYLQNYYVPYAPRPGFEERNQKFIEAYRKDHPGQLPDKYVALGYDGIYVLAKAITMAGSADPGKIRDALEKVEHDGLAGTHKFDSTGQSRPTVSVSQIRGGEPKLMFFANY